MLYIYVMYVRYLYNSAHIVTILLFKITREPYRVIYVHIIIKGVCRTPPFSHIENYTSFEQIKSIKDHLFGHGRHYSTS